MVFFADLKEISETAKLLKQKEIIIAKHFSDEKELSELRQKAKQQKTEFKFCHILQLPIEKEISAFDGKADFFALKGGTIQSNKIGVISKKINFLLQPTGRERIEFDSALANNARDNNVAIVVLFSDFLNAPPYDLVSLFRNYFLLAKICKKAKTKLCVFSGATSAVEMRVAMDLQSFLCLLLQNTEIEE